MIASHPNLKYATHSVQKKFIEYMRMILNQSKYNMYIQWLSIENQQGCDNSDVSFILTIFLKNFWNKWYLIWKP